MEKSQKKTTAAAAHDATDSPAKRAAGAVRKTARQPKAPAPTYHHGDLRNALITEGRRVLEEVGLQGLSLREVARSVGVSVAAPFHHFGDKEGLLAAIAANGFTELAALRSAIAASTADPMQRMYRTMECYVDFAERHKGLFNLMVGPRILEREDAKELVESVMSSFDLFASAVCDYARTQGWAQNDLDLVVHAAWSVEHGLAMLLLNDRIPTWGYKMDIKKMALPFSISLLLNGITAGPTSLATIASQLGPAGKRLLDRDPTNRKTR